MAIATRYFVLDSKGIFIRWYSAISGLETTGQALDIQGGEGDDSVYVGKGTDVKANNLTATGGNDAIYLLGKIGDYTQSNLGPVYTLTRNIDGETERVVISLSKGDRLYFADGNVGLEVDTWYDGETRTFKALALDADNPGEGTPDLSFFESQIQSGITATRIYILDDAGVDIPAGIKGSSFDIQGGAGDDSVYVGAGTNVKANNLTATDGKDTIYLMGKIGDYTQSNLGPVYTLTRNIDGQTERVVISLSNDDRLYFADGNLGLEVTIWYDEDTRMFTPLALDADNPGEGTPGLIIGPSEHTLALATDSGVSNSDNITNVNTVDVANLATNATWQYSLDYGDSWSNEFDGTHTSFELAADTTYAADQIQVRQIDENNNRGLAVSIQDEITTDNTPPDAITVTAITVSSLTPTLVGTATLEEGETLEIVFEGATYRLTPEEITSKNWLVNTGTRGPDDNTMLGTLVDGQSYDVMATITDVAGNRGSDTTSGEITVDTTVPSTPTIDSLTTNEALPVISGTATLGTNESLTVTIHGATYSHVPVKTGRWEIKTKEALVSTGELGIFEEGSYDVIAKVSNSISAKEIFDSTTLELVIVLTGPSDHTLALAEDTGVDGDGVTKNITVNVVNLASGASWHYSLDYGVSWSNELDAGTHTSFELAENTYYSEGQIQVKQRGENGNPGRPVSLKMAVTTDNVEPAAPTVASITTAEFPPLIMGTAELEANDSLVITFAGAMYKIENVAVQDGRWQVDTAATNPTEGVLKAGELIDGTTHSVMATVTDGAGNIAVDTTDNEITLSTTLPSTPMIDIMTTNNTTPVIKGTAPLKANESLTVTVNGASYELTPDDITDGNWSIDTAAAQVSSGTLQDFTEGRYDVTAMVTNTDGDKVSDQTTAELTIDLTGPSAQTLALAVDSGVSSEDRISNKRTVNIGNLEEGYKYLEYSLDDGQEWTQISRGDTQFDLAENTTYAAGQIQVKQTDRYGNIGEAVPMGEVVIDTNSPGAVTASLVADTGESTNDELTNDNTVSIGSIESEATVEYSTDGGDSWVSIPESEIVEDKASFELADNTTYDAGKIQVKQTDRAGNSSDPVTVVGVGVVTTDNSATISLMPIASDGIIDSVEDDSELIVSGTTTHVEVDQTVEVTLNARSYTTKVTAEESWTLAIPAADIADFHGQVPLTAKVTDKAGNDATVSSYITHRPELVIKVNATTLSLGDEPADVTFTFGATVENFTKEAIIAPNGAISEFQTTDNRVWTAKYTPNVDISDLTNSISVGYQGWNFIGGGDKDKIPQLAAYFPVSSSNEDLQASGNTIEKVTGEHNAESNAVTAQFLAGDGSVTVALLTEQAANARKAFALVTKDADDALGSQTYGFIAIGQQASQASSTVSALQGTSGLTLSNRYEIGDILKVERIDGKINYYKNSKKLATIDEDQTTVGQALYFRASITTVGEKLENVLFHADNLFDQLDNTRDFIASSANFAIDTQVDNLGITLDNDALVAGAVATVTFTFGAAVDANSFTVANIIAPNGTISELKSADATGKVWTAIYTPDIDVQDTTNRIGVDYDWEYSGGGAPTVKQLDGYFPAGNIANVAVTGNSLRKDGGGASWDAGAFSEQFIAGDGSVSTTVAETNTERMLGLSDADEGTSREGIDYAILLGRNATFAVYESGTVVKNGGSDVFGSYTEGDVFTIKRAGTVITYHKNNGEKFYTSEIASSTDTKLYVDSSFYDREATLTNIIIKGEGLASQVDAQRDTFVSTSPNYTVNTPVDNPEITMNKHDFSRDSDPATVTFTFGAAVENFKAEDITVANGTITAPVATDAGKKTWTATYAPATGVDNDVTNRISIGYDGWNYVGGGDPEVKQLDVYFPAGNIANVDISGGNNLKKTVGSGSTSWDAGAFSEQYISGDGSVSVIAIEKNTARVFGLSDTDSDKSEGTIDYAMYLKANGELVVLENGGFKAKLEDYNEGDILSVRRAGTKITYLKNGDIQHHSLTPSATDTKLYFDSSFKDEGATLNSVVIKGDGLASQVDPERDVFVSSSRDYTVNTPVDNPMITMNNYAFSRDGDPATVTFTFGAAVEQSTFTEDDIIAPNGIITNLTPDAIGKVWTAKYNPAVDVDDASNTIGVGYDWNYVGAGRGTAAKQLDAYFPMSQVDNIEVDGNNIIKHLAGIGSVFSEQFIKGDGSVSVTVGMEGSHRQSFGLSEQYNKQVSDTIPFDYAIHLRKDPNSSYFQLYENGAVIQNPNSNPPNNNVELFGSYAKDDVFTIQRMGSEITYYHWNAQDNKTTMLYRSEQAVAPDTALHFIGSIVDNDGKFDNVVISGDDLASQAVFPRDLAAVSNNYEVTTSVDSLDIAMSKNTLGAGETATVTFTFGAAVEKFTEADIIAPNGTITTPTTSNGITWTATYTPDASDISDTTNTIDVGYDWNYAAIGGGGPVQQFDASFSESSNANLWIDGNSLKKIGGSTGWNVGGFSEQYISGDGSVSTTVAETDTNRMLGLSDADIDKGEKRIDYAVYLREDKVLQAYENGQNKGNVGTYAEGDVVTIRRTGTEITYHKWAAATNETTLLYNADISSATDTQLYFDSSFYHRGATLNNIVFGNGDSVASSNNFEVDTVVTPSLDLATVSVNQITLTFDEELSGNNVPASSAFDITVGNNIRTVTEVSVSGNQAFITFDGNAVVTNEMVTLSNVGSDRFKDLAGNLAAAEELTNILLATADTHILTGRVDIADKIYGTTEPDSITAKTGDDIIIALEGDDTLTGGNGSDTFVYRGGDGQDTITDFTVGGAGGDQLDLSDLLSYVEGEDLTDYIQVSDDGTDTLLSIDSSGVEGGTSFTQDVSITLQGVVTDLTSIESSIILL